MKHQRFYVWLALSAILFSVLSCTDDPFSMENSDSSTAETVGHDMIELGMKLEDPYSVKNITKALEAVYPTRAGRTDVTPTDMYVRFLPASEEEYDRLVAEGYDLMDHPLDYQILKDGDYYHDPAVDEDRITWQYAVLPHETKLPEGIRCEILDDCYIPSNDPSTKGDGLDWDVIEREAFRLTGNEDMLLPETKGGSTAPKGRITIVDEKFAQGKEFGVAGVRVVCNSFVKFAKAYTDRDGYYEMSRKYSSKVRYRIMFKNTLDFEIGFNLILVPASMSTLGKGPASGIDYTVTSQSDRKLFCRCAVNNAVYDYIRRCADDDMNIVRPPKNLRIWILQSLSASSAPMLRHGAILESGLFKKFLGSFSALVGLFLPDITVGAEGADTYSVLYSRTSHELAHASHFAQVGKSYWDKYIKYVITSFVTGGGEVYGDGSGDGAGECGVGEMWGYFMQSAMFADRYGGSMPSDGMSYWFRPQVFRYLSERGFSKSDIFRALTEDVNSEDLLRDRLLRLYPDRSVDINYVFNRYSE